MPRPVGSVKIPSYCCHRSSNRAYVTLNGKPRYLGAYNSPESKAEYDRVVAEFLNSGRATPAPPATTNCPTVSVILLAFWKWAQTRYVRPDGTPTGEAENYRLAIRELRRLYGDVPGLEFGPKKLKAFRAHVLKDRTEKDHATGAEVSRAAWCRTHANRQVKRVQQIFRWAASEEMIPASVPAALDTVKAIRQGEAGARESEPVTPVADDVVDATLPFLPPPVKALVQLQRLTGARGGELFPLRTCDIDRSRPVWRYEPVQHKTAHKGHARVIRFGPQAQEVLTPLLNLDLQAFLFRPAESIAWRDGEQKKKTGDKPLSPSRQAKAERAKPRDCRDRYNKASYARAVARACDRAFPPPDRLARQKEEAVKSNGRKHKRWETKAEWRKRLGDEGWKELQAWRQSHRWHPHQLRHTAGSVIRREADFEAAKIILGHRTDSMTQHYAERDDRKAEEVIARIG